MLLSSHSIFYIFTFYILYQYKVTVIRDFFTLIVRHKIIWFFLRIGYIDQIRVGPSSNVTSLKVKRDIVCLKKIYLTSAGNSKQFSSQFSIPPYTCYTRPVSSNYLHIE